ncbi:MAG: sugar transferase [Candidatus Sumerlaeia bacterium]
MDGERRQVSRESWLGRLIPMRRRGGAGRVVSSEAFREILDREMLRAERYNSPLTLMLVDVQGEGLSARDRDEALLSLHPIAAAVMRRIDQAGWFDEGRGSRLGVIFPHTHPGETARMQAEIRRRFEEVSRLRGNGRLGRVRVLIEIYGYPVDGRADESDDLQLLLFKDEDLLGADPEARRPEPLGNNSYPALAQLHLRGWRAIPLWKRAMDRAGAVALLGLFSWLFILIALAVKLTSAGPVFYGQERIGRRGRLFKMWKFRSMTANDAPSKAAHEEYLKQILARSANGTKSEVPMQKLGALDRRVTAVGKILRASSLDELPQLFNVLLGEMSLVGPRPCLPYEARCYPAWCCRRFDAMPGLTGLWQISGKNSTTFKQMIRMDIDYARRITPWLDLKILFMTGPTIAADVWREVGSRLRRDHRHVTQQA